MSSLGFNADLAILTNPITMFGLLIFLGFATFVLYLIKFNKDPYFPLKPYRKARAIILRDPGDSTSLTFAAITEAKTGDKGIFIKKYNQLLPNDTELIPGGTEDLIILGVDEKNTLIPMKMFKMSINDDVASVIEKLAHNEQVEEGFIARAADKLMALITPPKSAYLALSKMFLESHYHDAKTRAEEEYSDSSKKNQDKLMQFLNSSGGPVLALAAITMGAIFLIGNAMYEGTVKYTNQAYIDLSNAVKENQQLNKAVLQWCVDSLASGRPKKVNVDDIMKNLEEQAKTPAPQPPAPPPSDINIPLPS